MEDYIVSAIAADGTVRAFAALTTNIVKEAATLHVLSPVASAALGRTLTSAVLMSRLLKGQKDKLTIQIKGNGPLGGIIVVSDPLGNVRGYVHNPNVELPLNAQGKLDVSGAIGENGYLNIIKDLGLKEPYVGFVDLTSGEIAEDIAYYFYYSEQIPSVVSLGVLVDTDGSILNAGGYFIQLMPGAKEDTISTIENKISTIPSTTKLLLDGETPESILKMILGDMGLKITGNTSCRYLCNCSRARMEAGLISLGKTELMEMVKEQHGAELQCHFCNQQYHFTEEELLSLIP